MKKNRVEAFTDAIVAIILTIMVLEIKVPEGTSEFSALIEKAPYFIAFIISFIFIISIPSNGSSNSKKFVLQAKPKITPKITV